MKKRLSIILTTFLAIKFASAQPFDLMTVNPQNKVAESPFFTMNNNAMNLFANTNFAHPFAIVQNDTFIVERPSSATSVDQRSDVIRNFQLEQNYPNPFNHSTVVRYSVSEEADVTIKVYDIAGREIETLVNSNQVPGTYSIGFGKNSLSSGTYFYRMTTKTPAGATTVETKKMIVMK